MALRFVDGFDHVNAIADLARKWNIGVYQNTPGIGVGSGRYGGGNTLNRAHAREGYRHTFGGTEDVFVVGCAVRFNSLTTLSQLPFIFQLFDGSTQQCGLGINANQKLYILRGNTVIGVEGTTVLTTAVWYYIEAKFTIHNTLGAIRVKINTVDEFNQTGLDTQQTANQYANGIALGGVQNGASTGTGVDHDDLYVVDDTGATNNDFLGDIRVETIYPNGNGNSSQFDGSDGNSTDNYLLVDETDSDDDTTYVQSPDVADKDTYAYSNLSTSAGTVYGLQLVPLLRKTDAGSRTFVTVARLSGTETDGSATALFDTYQYFPDIRETKPGGGAWSISDVNNAEFGIKVNT